MKLFIFWGCILFAIIFQVSCSGNFIPAVFTGFTEKGELDSSVVSKQAAYFAKVGIESVFIAGTTGESLSLTVQEREQLTLLWTEQAMVHNLSVIVHVSCESIVDSRRLASHAQAHGARGIAWFPSVYNKPGSFDSIVIAFESVANAALSLDAYYYHIPSRTGIASGKLPELMERIMHGNYITNFAGVKASIDSAEETALTMNLYNFKSGRATYFSGSDPTILATHMAAGVSNYVGSYYNFNAPLAHRILDLYDQSKVSAARQLQTSFTSLIHAVNTWGPSYAPDSLPLKELANLLASYDSSLPSVGPPRLPYLPASKGPLEKLEKIVQQWCQSGVHADFSPSWCVSILSYTL